MVGSIGNSSAAKVHFTVDEAVLSDDQQPGRGFPRVGQAIAREAMRSGLIADHLNEIFSVLGERQPASRAALSAVVARSQGFSSYQDPLMQLVRAKTLADFPSPYGVLTSLGLSEQGEVRPEAAQALVGVLDRHVVHWIDRSQRPLNVLGTFVGHLLRSNPNVLPALWRCRFKHETLAGLHNLYADERMTIDYSMRGAMQAWVRKALVIHQLQSGRLSVARFSPARLADKDLMLAAVGATGRALESVSEPLKADREVVLAAVSQNGLVLEYASDAMKANRDVVLEAVSENGLALEHASDALKADRALVEVAVRCGPRALQFASDALRADKALVLEAVGQCGWLLEYASAELRADRAVVLAAVNVFPWALEYASDALRSDRALVLDVVRRNGDALACASVTLMADREVVLAAVAHDGSALRYASDALRTDREVVRVAVLNSAQAFLYASAQLQADGELLSMSIRGEDTDLSDTRGKPPRSGGG